MTKTEVLNLETNAERSCAEIEAFIRSQMQELKRDGAVIGLSGGLDSAVTALLVIRSIGKGKVHLLNIPERDSNPVHRADAKRFAAEFGLELNVVDITGILRASKAYRTLPIWMFPSRKIRAGLVRYGRERLISHNDERMLLDRIVPEGNEWMEKGNSYGMAKHRMRMALVYQYAEVRNLMVVGCANHTELLTGTFCKWGIDHCADIMPIIHLYRSQVEVIAKFIGVPVYIRSKPADPDLYPTNIDKGEFLGGFQTADQILLNLEKNVAKDMLYAKFDPKLVDYLSLLYSASRHMRESPYHL